MKDIEKLGLFYLGRTYDLAAHALQDEPVLYDSRDLVTHAVCVGMTGSGKTGLCLGLIEEAAIDGVPVLAIDPKGDLGNLLLTFPSLSPAEFRPWIDEDEARRAGLSPDAFAAAEAARWKEGLEASGQDAGRIARLRAAAEFTIYTPGSRAGVPVSILSSFAAPTGAARDDGEALAERAAAAASGVLTLAGADATPRGREHTLVSAILVDAWRNGRDLDVAAIIQQIQQPPFPKIGIVDVESFFPARERFDLAMRLNGLLAAPGFDQWLEGAPLDPASLLYTPAGKPRVAIFSIAHLGDAERMFFVSMLLNQVVAWMRTQTGTSSLRALVYMDEIAGYLPPVATPPSKAPFLTLLKQGRAFGCGVALATQNPVDLDYKALSNIGTWFLGRLQTERDKARLLDGLEGAAAGALDRAEADRLLSALDKRVFLMHDVHASGPMVFQTRWTLSYLRGPLSRDQIRQLSPAPDAPAPRPVSTPATSSAAPAAPPAAAVAEAPPRAAAPSADPPVIPPAIRQYFVPRTTAGGDGSYRPVLLGAARIAYGRASDATDQTSEVLLAAPIADGPVPVDWTAATALDVTPADLLAAPEPPARFAPVPAPALQAKSYAGWEKAFSRHLAQSQRVTLLQQADLGLTSRAGESERDFRIRIQDAQRAARDAAMDDLRKKFAARQASLADKLRRAEAAVEREREQASHQKLQTGVSMAATVLGALFGRRAIGVGSLGRATTAARGVGRTMKEEADVKRASEQADALRQQAGELEAELTAETQRIAAAYSAVPELTRTELAPRRGGIDVQFVGLGWLPEDAKGR